MKLPVTCPAFLRTTAALTGLLLLGACANTPDSHFYTLAASGDIPTGARNNGSNGTLPMPPGTPGTWNTAGGSTTAPLLIELTPVNMPAQVSRPEIVTMTGSGTVKIEDYNRWSGPLGDEISSALSQSLTGMLGAVDTYRAPRPAGSTAYRITVNVKRFESVKGERALIDTVWSVVRSTDSLTMTCRSVASEPVADGFDNLAAGHRKALMRIAGDIAAGVRAEQVVRVASDTTAFGPTTKASDTAEAASGTKAHPHRKAGNAASVEKSSVPPAPIVPVVAPLCPMNANATS